MDFSPPVFLGGPTSARRRHAQLRPGATRLMDAQLQHILRRGIVIPAHPLALDAQRRLDERRQRALSRYDIASGAGGLAVGVHTTQFAIRRPEIDLYRPVLALAADEMARADRRRDEPLVSIAGLCGPTAQAAPRGPRRGIWATKPDC